MGSRGPQPDSQEMRKRKGFPGNRGRSEPKPTKSIMALTKLPFAPKTMNVIGKQEWKRIGPSLVEEGKLSLENLKLFEAYCYSYGVFQEIQRKFEQKEEAYVVFVGPTAAPKPNPLVAMAKDAQNMMLKMLRAIQTSTTLSPASKQDPLEQFFKKAEKLKVVKK